MQKKIIAIEVQAINLSMAAPSIPIDPIPMPLFPTMGSLQEVIDMGCSQLPITDKNELTSLLMTYHNTLLDQVKHDNNT